jgi:hypothetical protein
VRAGTRRTHPSALTALRSRRLGLALLGIASGPAGVALLGPLGLLYVPLLRSHPPRHAGFTGWRRGRAAV